MAAVEGWIDWVSVPNQERGKWSLGFFMEPWRLEGESKWRKGTLVCRAPVSSAAVGRRLEARLREGGSYRFVATKDRRGRMLAKERPALVDDVPEPGERPQEIIKRHHGYELTIVKAMSRRLGEAMTRADQCEKARRALANAATKKLTKLYNNKWADSGTKITEAALERKLGRIIEMQISPRSTVMYLNAGTLFGDHLVCLELTAAGKLVSASLA